MAKCSASYGLVLACFAVAVAMADATQFIVGGSNGWSVPPAGAESLNSWAMKNRFQVGDTLVFVYPSDQDSVLLVDPSDYNSCNTSSYQKKFTDGDTTFTLDRPGAFFFISGVDANCRNNEKLIVMVLAAGRNATGGGAPTPSTTTPPPATPTTAPPPSTPSSPPPPPASSSPPPPASPAPKSPTAASPPPPVPAPTTTPTSTPPPASSPPAAPASSPPSAPPASTASPPAPGTHGNSTSSPPHSAGSNNHKNGAGLTVSAGFVGSVGACIVGFAMLAL
ncbi:hypothetical protein EJB05_24426 [Eragrostis curvula]|uniref:Phytocyanin domain-containing protein n=1 Tax=Eragrostis curvula TaxID=38414 RepID=A0A5J9V9F5_9POAL|nr:hypothetical protein EJB05_24426 [Eragrostis curvula]